MSSGFISENEINERKKLRQQEWEKVRTADQPLEAPEEPFDNRSLFDRLQEQKQKKDYEYEEAHKLKNMIKGLDDDEVEFLDLVDRTKLEEERKKLMEEAKEMAEFRDKVATLQEENLAKRIQAEIKPKNPPVISNNSNRPSQTKLLAGAIIKKRPAESSQTVPEKKLRLENTEGTASKSSEEKSKTNNCADSSIKGTSVLQCIGILPGLASYENSSDSESSSSEDELSCNYDLLGRKIENKDITVSK